jgi:hypothetical protein
MSSTSIATTGSRLEPVADHEIDALAITLRSARRRKRSLRLGAGIGELGDPHPHLGEGAIVAPQRASSALKKLFSLAETNRAR